MRTETMRTDTIRMDTAGGPLDLVQMPQQDFEKLLVERDLARREADRLLKCGQEAEEKAVHLQEQIKAQEALLDLQRADCERALSERDAVRKRYQEAEDRVVGFQTQLTAQEEVIERLKAQNVSFVEERREAQGKAARLTKELDRAKNDVSRLVELSNAFKDRLAAVIREKDAVTDQLRLSQADYDARGRVIKKLRKRLHRLKKKLKH